MNQTLHVLIVDDSEDDANLLLHTLRRDGYDVVYEVVDTPSAMRAALESQDWDVITSDHAMPQFSAPAALALAKELRPSLPFIILSGEIDFNLAVSLMKGGAQDYIEKRELPRIVPAIERELKEAESIIKRKRAEEALRRSEENFRHSFDNSPMGVRIVTEKGETIYANEALLNIYGYDSIEDLETTPVEKRYSTESYADFLSRREKRRRGDDNPSEYTINIIRKDGEVRHLQVFRREAIWDDEKQFQVSYNDITDRKQAEEALRTSEAHYRLLAEHMTDIVWMMDLDLNVTWLSPSAVKARGFSVDEIVALSLDRQLTPDSLRKAVNWLGKLMRLEKDGLISEHDGILSRELAFYCKDGRTILLDCAFQFIRDEQGKATGILAEGKDITERKQIEEKLRTSRSQLRALATRLQQIREEEGIRIAREVHDEMGGGLTGLKMDLSQMLHMMDDTDPGEARVALLDRIHTCNALIDHMIHAVRRISTDLRPSVLEDLGLVAALEWQLSEFTTRNEIPHEFATPLEYVDVEEDTAVAVFRIFQEALTNVVRHARASKVAVVLREEERSLSGDECLVLEIRDNGRGITDEEILHTDSLGLLGMKERVMAFGGELSICREPGGGTALILKIPRKQGEAP